MCWINRRQGFVKHVRGFKKIMFQSGFFYRFVGCCLLDDHHPEAEVTRLQQQARKRDLDDKAREAKGKGKGKAREGAKESNQKPAKAPRRRRRPKPQLSLSPRSHRLRQLRQIQVMRLVRLRSQVREAVPRRPSQSQPLPLPRKQRPRRTTPPSQAGTSQQRKPWVGFGRLCAEST